MSRAARRRPAHARLNRADIEQLLTDLEANLAQRDVRAEIYVFGGAAIILAFDVQRVTDDVDAVFAPKEEVLEAADAVAHLARWRERGLRSNWLNDDVSYLEPAGWPVLEAPGSHRHLVVTVADPGRLLAMKMLASRLEDEDDLALLGRALGLGDDPDAWMTVMRRYYPKATRRFTDRAAVVVRRLIRRMPETAASQADHLPAARRSSPKPSTTARRGACNEWMPRARTGCVLQPAMPGRTARDAEPPISVHFRTGILRCEYDHDEGRGRPHPAASPRGVGSP